jgi:hypothetical protein
MAMRENDASCRIMQVTDGSKENSEEACRRSMIIDESASGQGRAIFGHFCRNQPDRGRGNIAHSLLHQQSFAVDISFVRSQA